jgi:hypothetical protein
MPIPPSRPLIIRKITRGPGRKLSWGNQRPFFVLRVQPTADVLPASFWEQVSP